MASRTIVGLATICMVLPALSVPATAAESCLDEVSDLAEQHGVSTNPPSPGPPSPGKSKRELGESGGVVEPPAVRDDEAVISPPAESRGTMREVAPQDPAGKRVTLQAILTAARAEAERGNDAGCREGLSRANKVLDGGR